VRASGRALLSARTYHNSHDSHHDSTSCMIRNLMGSAGTVRVLNGWWRGCGAAGTIARAGRAARAGSRAGRTIKLPRLFGKVYTTLSTCFSSSR